jgi:hypothetical protein
MAQPQFKEAGKLAQGLLTAGNQTLLTVPAGEMHMITGLHLANPGASDEVVEYWQDGSAGLNTIQPQVTVKARARLPRDLGGTLLSPGSTIVAFARDGNKVAFTLNGVKWTV